MKERIKHTLTLYHYKGKYKIMFCSCGWKDRRVRWLNRRIKLRSIFLCRGNHLWDEPSDVSIGPAGAPDEEFEVLATQRQCDRCWTIEDIS